MDSIQQAIQDVSMIRKAIERAGSSEQPGKARRAALWANLMVQSISLILVLMLIVYELVSDHLTTRIMLLSVELRELGTTGLFAVGASLPLFVLCLYFIVWRSARHGEQDFSAFVTANFRYLRSLSLVADLAIKFVVLSLIVLGGHPAWIGPVLALFTGDYLFQGRFFNFPLHISLALGLLCMVIAAVLFLTGTALLVWPLALFGVINALSLVGLLRARRRIIAA